MNDWIIRLIEQGGYWGIVFLMALENIFPPIPSELIMGVGGIAVARGTMEFWPLMVAGSIDCGSAPLMMVRSALGSCGTQPARASAPAAANK